MDILITVLVVLFIFWLFHFFVSFLLYLDEDYKYFDSKVHFLKEMFWPVIPLKRLFGKSREVLILFKGFKLNQRIFFVLYCLMMLSFVSYIIYCIVRMIHMLGVGCKC